MDLLVALIRHVVTKGANAGQHGASAVLVFMPGLAEITDLFDRPLTNSGGAHTCAC